MTGLATVLSSHRAFSCHFHLIHSLLLPFHRLSQQVGEFSADRMADFGAAMTTADEAMLQQVLEELNVGNSAGCSRDVPTLEALQRQQLSSSLCQSPWKILAHGS